MTAKMPRFVDIDSLNPDSAPAAQWAAFLIFLAGFVGLF
jgi:hypothetical protein